MFRVLSSFNSRVHEFNVSSGEKNGLVHHQRDGCVPRIKRVCFVPVNRHLMMTRFLGDVDGPCKAYNSLCRTVDGDTATPYIVYSVSRSQLELETQRRIHICLEK
jgi:hypothetical protein